MTIVTEENKKISTPKVKTAAEMMRVSIRMIANAISNEEDLDMILASISVPPLLVSYRSMSPMPNPMITPPIMELVSIDKEKTFFSGFSQSMKREVKSRPWTLL